MTPLESCMILYGPTLEPLGEIVLDQDVCRHVSLNQKGESVLGTHMANWQIQGLENVQPTSIMTAEGTGEAYGRQNVPMQSFDFVPTLQNWLDDHGFAYLTLPLAAMLAWSEIQKMDLEPQQKYELAVMLRDLPVSKLMFE